MALCDGCGSSYSDSFEFCPHCGRQKPKNKEIQVTIQDNSGLACLVCQRADRVEKVSAILHSQTSTVQGSVPVSQVYTDNEGKIRTSTSYEKYTNTQSSALAQQLQPPQKPAVPKKPSKLIPGIMGIITVISIVVMLLSFIVFGPTENYGLVSCRASLSFIFGVPALVLWFLYASQNKTYPERLVKAGIELTLWERAMRN